MPDPTRTSSPLFPTVASKTSNRCLSCKQDEAPARKGAKYFSDGANGVRVKFWLCNDCAIPLGIPQGYKPLTE
jgi:hypothetical protein